MPFFSLSVCEIDTILAIYLEQSLAPIKLCWLILLYLSTHSGTNVLLQGAQTKSFQSRVCLPVSTVVMVGLSNPFCWAWRQKGRPESIWGLWGNTGRGEYCRLGEEGWGRNECKSRTARWVGDRGSGCSDLGTGLGMGMAGGLWSWVLWLSLFPLPSVCPLGEVRAPSSFLNECVPLSLERLVRVSKKGMATGCQTQLCPSNPFPWF